VENPAEIVGSVSRPSSLIEALQNPACYDDGVVEVRVVETHISWILLTGQYAYKVKKPVKLSFVDFSTLELRRHFCEEELRLNKRLAKELYLAVVPIGGSADSPELSREPAIEYAVKMRQFPDDARLDSKLAMNAVEADAIVELAERIADFHMALPSLGIEDISIERQIGAVMSNLTELEERLAESPLFHRLTLLREWTEAQCRRIRPTIAARVGGGAYKEGHGDLHVENLIMLEEIIPFDALEFDPELRRIDVMSEVGFLSMDLMAHGRPDFAYLFLNRTLEITGDYLGLEVLRFYLVYRALVRAKVQAIKDSQESKRVSLDEKLDSYISLAEQLVSVERPLLLITHGLSGSGKTHISSRLIGPLRALRVRSDIQRKRLHGLSETARSGSAIRADLYTPDATQKTYRELERCARTALRDGINFIVDAAFLEHKERARFRALAEQETAQFVILDCQASEQSLRQRVLARAAQHEDASEATSVVLDDQIARREPLDTDELSSAIAVDTDAAVAIESIVTRILSRSD